MNSLPLISLALLLGAAMYGLRLSGLLLANSPLPAHLLKALRHAPVALLAALLLPGLLQGGAPAELLLRLVPLLFAALLAYWSRRIDVGLVGGLSLYGLMVVLF